MTSLKYVAYHSGNPKLSSHIDAVHAASPDSDQYTGPIVEGVVQSINASAIIGTVSRRDMDINRLRSTTNAPAIDAFREAIRLILQSKSIIGDDGQLSRHYLHLAIHGMTDDHDADFIVGTRHGESCAEEILQWFLSLLQRLSTKIKLNQSFPGDSSKSFHRHGDPDSNYRGYGDKFHTIQIEINRTWRKEKRKDLIQFFSMVIASFDNKFNP